MSGTLQGLQKKLNEQEINFDDTIMSHTTISGQTTIRKNYLFLLHMLLFLISNARWHLKLPDICYLRMIFFRESAEECRRLQECILLLGIGVHRSAQECPGVHRSVQECTELHRSAQECTDVLQPFFQPF